ncbi:conserved hypothetical protein [Histoplasma capsulatum H143]|uniref:Uncharacterized protein n=1 Tax=Ajellomyces capsulatus (strain H143) TaxID=544712 RepID=C6HAT2_AJECH|nr:conserved hypothetical protein [Histoplasma capsulatum H143]
MASSAGAPQSPAVAHHLRSLGVGSDPSQPSPQKIFNEIIHKIPTIQKFTEIIYENISPSDGALICQSLEASEHVERRNIRVNFNAFTRTLRIRIMPTELHEAHQRWAYDALVEWTQDACHLAEVHNVPGGRVKGGAEIWRRNGTGNLATTEMTIFPVPNTPVINEHIEFTKGQLFGAAAIGCPDAGTVLSLRISRLREITEERLVKNMGLMPA